MLFLEGGDAKCEVTGEDFGLEGRLTDRGSFGVWDGHFGRLRLYVCL